MADGRTFTEGEAYALVADAVTRETAAVVAEKETLTGRLTEVETARDEATAAQTAAETARDAAVQELADFKAGIEARQAAEEKRTERLAKLAEVAPNLKVEDERADRIVAMSDEAFSEMVETVRETAATTTPPAATPPAAPIPRQSAAFAGSSPAADDKGEGRVLAFIGARRKLTTTG